MLRSRLLVALTSTALLQCGTTTLAQQDPGSETPKAGQDGSGAPKDRSIPEGCWFDKVHLDFGSHVEDWNENKLAGTYHFVNKTKAAQQITQVLPSCKCQSLKLFVNGKEVILERKVGPERELKHPIQVPAGAKGRVALKFDVSGAPGQRVGDIRIDTTDPKMSSFTLTCAAHVTPAFVLTPATVALGQLAPTDKRDWKVEVRSMLSKTFKVNPATPPIPAGLAVTSVEQKKDDQGQFWVIKGTYGPDLEEGAAGGNLLFSTDDPKHSFQVQVLAEVRERLKLTPSFFSLKSYPRNLAKKHTVYVWPSDLKNEKNPPAIDHVEIVRCTISKDFVSFKIVPPAKGAPIKIKGMIDPLPAESVWKVIVQVKAGVKKRLIRVRCKIHFKGDAVAKTFGFNGFPRDPH